MLTCQLERQPASGSPQIRWFGLVDFNPWFLRFGARLFFWLLGWGSFGLPQNIFRGSCQVRWMPRLPQCVQEFVVETQRNFPFTEVVARFCGWGIHRTPKKVRRTGHGIFHESNRRSRLKARSTASPWTACGRSMLNSWEESPGLIAQREVVGKK